MSEIATWSMIRSKISSFPAPTSGRGNECLTKSEIISLGGENVRVEGTYGNAECVMLDDVLANVITWEYTLSVSPTSLSYGYSGGTQSIKVTSYKRKYINGSYTGTQIEVGFTGSASGAGFSSAGTSVTASQNNSLSSRSGTMTFTQSESGKTAKVTLSQAAGVEGWNYTFNVTPTSLSFEATGGTRSVSVTSYRRQTINGSETGVQENVGYTSSISGTGFSSNGTLIKASNNTSTSPRSGSMTFIQTESGKIQHIALIQKEFMVLTDGIHDVQLEDYIGGDTFFGTCKVSGNVGNIYIKFPGGFEVRTSEDYQYTLSSLLYSVSTDSMFMLTIEEWELQVDDGAIPRIYESSDWISYEFYPLLTPYGDLHLILSVDKS